MHASLLEGVIPSLTTTKAFLDTFIGCPINEFGFLQRRIAALPTWLRRIGAADVPFLAVHSDATSVIPRVRWRPCDDAIFGAAIPDQKLPHVDLHAGSSANELLAQLEHYGLATQVDVILVGPLHPKAPRYVLAMFAQTSGGDAEVLKNRWAIVENELHRLGLHVVCIGVDGGGANASAQRKYARVQINFSFF